MVKSFREEILEMVDKVENIEKFFVAEFDKEFEKGMSMDINKMHKNLDKLTQLLHWEKEVLADFDNKMFDMYADYQAQEFLENPFE